MLAITVYRQDGLPIWFVRWVTVRIAAGTVQNRGSASITKIAISRINLLRILQFFATAATCGNMRRRERLVGTFITPVRFSVTVPTVESSATTFRRITPET